MSDKLAGGVKAGSTGVSLPVLLLSTSTGQEVTAKVASDVTASYWRQGGIRVAITVSDLTNVNDAYSSGGWKQVDATNQPGAYRFDVPDAAFDVGADWVIVSIKVSGCFVHHERFDLETKGAAEVYSRLGAPAGASTAADIAAVSAKLPALVGGRVDASVGAYQTGSSPLQPTVAGRTLDVSAGGEAGVDLANVGSPTTVLNLSGTSVKTATDVEADTQNIQSRIPAALVGGRIDASVGAMAANVLTATAIATDAITAAKVAADAVAEIQSGLSTLNAAGVRSAVGLGSANLDTQLAAIAGYLDTEITSILSRIGGFTGTSNNNILGFLQALARKTAALTPSDMGGTYDNTTDSLEAIRDRGDAAWITGAGGGGGGGFSGANAVTLTFLDAGSNPVANTTFTLVGVGSGTTDGNGAITIGLNDGSYTVNVIPQNGVLWNQESFTVSGDGSFSFTGVTAESSGLTDRTAAYLVDLVREILGTRGGQEPFRDGFTADESYAKNSKSILAMLNTVQREISESGYYKCYFDITFSAGTTEDRNDQISLDRRIHRIRSVTLRDALGKFTPLTPTSEAETDRDSPQQRNFSTGKPTQYSFDGDLFTLNRSPNATYTVTILAETVAPDLELETDVPLKLPARFHEMLAYGAAMMLLYPQLSEEKYANMYRAIEMKFNTMYNDLKKNARSKVLSGTSSALLNSRR